MEKKLKEWQIGSRLLQFDEDQHQYFVDGKACSSVTQLLKSKFPDKYSKVNKKVLERSRELGKELHEAIDVYESYGLEREDLIEFVNYKVVKEIYEFDVIATEVPVIFDYENLTVCGTLDLFVKVKKEFGIIDTKRTTKLDGEYIKLQLNLYRLAYQQCYKQAVDFLRVMQLKNKIRKYETVQINEEAAFAFLDECREEL